MSKEKKLQISKQYNWVETIVSGFAFVICT